MSIGSMLTPVNWLDTYMVLLASKARRGCRAFNVHRQAATPCTLAR